MKYIVLVIIKYLIIIRTLGGGLLSFSSNGGLKIRSLHERLDLSADEKELFCAFNFETTNEIDRELNADLSKEQGVVAQKLADLFKTGSEDVAKNSTKEETYRSLAKARAEGSTVPAPRKFKFGLHLFYELHSWYTAFRISTLGINSVVRGITGNPFLTRLFSVAGFSYALSIIVSIIDIAHTVKTEKLSPEEAKLPYWKVMLRRIKNIFCEDDYTRLFRMLNDVGSLAFNLAGFILTGGLSAFLAPLVGLGGFGFDVLHETVKSYFQLKKYPRLEAKIDKEIKSIEQEQVKLKVDLQSLRKRRFILEQSVKAFEEDERLCQQRLTSINQSLRFIGLSDDPDSQFEVRALQFRKSVLEERLQNLQDKREDYCNSKRELAVIRENISLKQKQMDINEREIEKLSLVKVKVKEKKEEASLGRARIVTGMVLALVGLGLSLWPPTFVLGCCMMGVGGCLVLGVGKKLHDLASEYLPKLPGAVGKLMDKLFPSEDDKKLDLQKEMRPADESTPLLRRRSLSTDAKLHSTWKLPNITVVEKSKIPNDTSFNNASKRTLRYTLSKNVRQQQDQDQGYIPPKSSFSIN